MSTHIFYVQHIVKDGKIISSNAVDDIGVPNAFLESISRTTKRFLPQMEKLSEEDPELTFPFKDLKIALEQLEGMLDSESA